MLTGSKQLSQARLCDKQLANNGSLWCSRVLSPSAGAKTILSFMHFDGQRCFRNNGRKRPGSPCSRRARQRQVGEIDRDKLKGDKIDPDWRLFARAGRRDKGPIMMFLTASTHSRRRGLIGHDVKVLLDTKKKEFADIGNVAGKPRCPSRRRDRDQ